MREQKLKAATEIVAAGTHLYHSQLDGTEQRRLSTAERVMWQDRLQAGRSHIHLLCRRETRDAADKFVSLVWRREGTENVADDADVVEALKALTDHLRHELRSDRSP